jgi:hypothetical protein
VADIGKDILTRVMALMIAEHGVMRARLMELEELCPDLPLRWKNSGEPIVDLNKTISDYIQSKEQA